jgi:hypothetical protein
MSIYLKKWTDEDIEEVKRMASLEYTAAEIAQNFEGRTRNSVIGMCHRNGIRLNSPKVSANPRVRAPRQQPSKPTLLNFRVSALTGASQLVYGNPAAKTKPKPPTPVVDHELLDKTLWGSVTMRDLSNGSMKQCRFIAGPPQGLDTVFCGEPVVMGYSWCAEHKKIVYPPRASK